MDLCLSSGKGDHNHAGLVATRPHRQRHPAVVAAPAGIRDHTRLAAHHRERVGTVV